MGSRGGWGGARWGVGRVGGWVPEQAAAFRCTRPLECMLQLVLRHQSQRTSRSWLRCIQGTPRPLPRRLWFLRCHSCLRGWVHGCGCVCVWVCVCVDPPRGDPPGGSPRGIPDPPGGFPRGILVGIPKGIPPWGSPQGIRQGDPPGGSPQGIPPEDPSRVSPSKTPQGTPQGIPQGISQGIPSPQGGSPTEHKHFLNSR